MSVPIKTLAEFETVMEGLQYVFTPLQRSRCGGMIEG